MVTLKSTSGIFAVLVFPTHKQITVSFIFHYTLSLIGDLFVLPHVLHVNLIN